MRFFVIMVLVLTTSGTAVAQSCVTSGNAIYCNDGVTGQRFGTSTYWSDGLSSHLSRQRLGNPTTYFNNGATSRTFGNTTYFSDGKTCTRVGNTQHCN